METYKGGIRIRDFDKHFTVNMSPDIQHINEDIKKVVLWPEDCSVSSISMNFKTMVSYMYSGLDLPCT